MPTDIPWTDVTDWYVRQYRWSGMADAPVECLAIHGAGSDHTVWNLLVACTRTVSAAVPIAWFAVDLPGHGRSPRPAADTIVAYAEALTAWPRTGRRQVLVGHSMGGAIALESAIRFPRRWDGLILVATGARLRVHPDLRTRLDTGDKRGAIEWLLRWLFGPRATPEVRKRTRQKLERTLLATLRADFSACHHFDRMGDLDRVRIPTLVLVGTADRMTPVTYGEYLAHHITHAQLRQIPDAGHMIMLETPESLARGILAFLQERVLAGP